MTNWIHKEDVTVDTVYKRLDVSETYLIKLRIPIQDSIFTEGHEILISDTNMLKELKELVEGKRERCYFAYGMTDIDFYKVGDKYAITDSPNAGYNIQLILANSGIEAIIRHLEYASQQK